MAKKQQTTIKLKPKDAALVFNGEGLELYLPKGNDEVDESALIALGIASLFQSNNEIFNTILQSEINKVIENEDD